MRKKLIALALMITIILIMSTTGCSKLFKKDPTPDPNIPGINDPSGEDPVDPGDNPDISTDNRLSAPVTRVPQEAVTAISFAAIRKGDLWLGSDKDHLWRQTDSELVFEAVWAPDGHALAFLTMSAPEEPSCDLYTLVPGESPVLIDKDVTAISAMLNTRGFIWSPDSTMLAYSKGNGTEIATAGPGEGRGSFLIDLELEQGPYWLSNDRLAYSSTGERPSLVVVNTIGDIINTLPDTSGPFPLKDGLFALTGEYDPEGMMSFFYTGIVHTGTDGNNIRQVFTGGTDSCLFSWNPHEPSREGDARYFALSSADSLYLQKYAGDTGAQQIKLLTQDVFLTYSEFSYPFWFAWAPDGNSLAVLRFTLTLEGEYGEQEGIWDLGIVDRNGNWQLLQEELYSVGEAEEPIPFRILPLNWALNGSQINYLVENNDGDDVWQINLADKKGSLFLENSSLPEYRP